MIRAFGFFFILVCLALSSQISVAQEKPSCTLGLSITGAITPATLDYFERGLKESDRQGCSSILLSINTPGGNLQTTRLIVEKILASKVPILCLVTPPGGHAGSAGAIILMACHVSGAEAATNIGAATPITLEGDMEKDLRAKMIQDTTGWVQGLAKLRGRNEKFAEAIISEAKSVDASTAAEIKAIDMLAPDRDRFLEFAAGRDVSMVGGHLTKVEVGALTSYATDTRFDLLQFITDPEIAYLIFMGSIALLFFEITHPGTVAPGVLGVIGLIVSLMAFHKIAVGWGALALMFVGIAMLILEVFVTSFGILGVGGLIALGLGSFLLYDPSVTGFRLPISLIAAVVGTLAVILFGLMSLMWKTRRLGAAMPEVALIGRIGKIMSLESPSRRRGMIQVSGENWNFQSEKDLEIGMRAKVVAQEGLTLKIEPVDG